MPSQELFKFEKDLLGFYITSHPLTEHQAALERYSTATTREALTMSAGVEVTIGGMINPREKSHHQQWPSAGMPMGIITLEDLEGQIDGTMFAETYAESSRDIPGRSKTEAIVFVRGKIDRNRETPSLLINEVLPIAEAMPKLTTTVLLKLEEARQRRAVEADQAVVGGHKGNFPLFVQTESRKGRRWFSSCRRI